ncbi:MAG: replicative DNA helicase [Phycisphaeraceae bacterium]|nr:replicative DNA helicase [Phycisphaeraceae bacterium]
MSTANTQQRTKRTLDLARLHDQPPPASIEHEMCLLGAMILDFRMVGEVIGKVGEEDFYQARHAAVFRTLTDLYDANEPIEMPGIVERLRGKGQLEEVGGVDYLLQLASNVPAPTSAPYYAKVVRESAIRRRLIETAASILDRAYRSDEPVLEQLNTAESEIFQLALSRAQNEAVALKQLIDEAFKQLESSQGRVLTGLDTGFADLNKFTSGFHKGELIIVAARPSMGKTAFALNIAEHMAVDRKMPVVVFSLEMSRVQLAQRMLCSRSGVDAQALRSNTLSPHDFERLFRAAPELSDAPLFIDDTPGLDLLSLKSKARRLAERHHIRAIFVDYLQLMSCPGSADNRQQEVSAISRGIKALARELDVPVVCLSQLNRGPESRDGNRPRMSDLRESGAIEQDADVVLMLHREDYYKPKGEDFQPSNTAECIIAKQRNGPTSTVRLVFNGSTVRFGDYAAGYEDH